MFSKGAVVELQLRSLETARELGPPFLCDTGLLLIRKPRSALDNVGLVRAPRRGVIAVAVAAELTHFELDPLLLVLVSQPLA